ncbi:MAG: peptide chain release factor 1 [Clostridiales bacterium]|nr:peptide chain release factor 1 [Clostridiales bacterium]
MLEKLKALEEKYEQLTLKLSDPGIYSDAQQAARLFKEQKELIPIVEAYRRRMKREGDLEEARQLLSTNLDADFREMVQEELDSARQDIAAIDQQLKLLLLPSDPNDSRSVVMEIRAGAGGEEAALFASSLFRMYSMYSESHRWKVEVVNANETELGGLKEISFIIEGSGVWSRLKFEGGVHRVQRVPDTEASGRIHTSTVTVAVLPEAEEVELEINPGELQIDTFRSSGAGGQHVNKTESAIRITHLPTGIVVECQDERSQHKNRDRAMKILRAKLYDLERSKQTNAIAAERRSQVGTGDRSERIRTYNFPQGRVTDHRVGLTLYKIESIMNGDIDEIIDTLITADQAERLREGSGND